MFGGDNSVLKSVLDFTFPLDIEKWEIEDTFYFQ
jgi:hypothetical protein